MLQCQDMWSWANSIIYSFTHSFNKYDFSARINFPGLKFPHLKVSDINARFA